MSPISILFFVASLLFVASSFEDKKPHKLNKQPAIPESKLVVKQGDALQVGNVECEACIDFMNQGIVIIMVIIHLYRP